MVGQSLLHRLRMLIAEFPDSSVEKKKTANNPCANNLGPKPGTGYGSKATILDAQSASGKLWEDHERPHNYIIKSLRYHDLSEKALFCCAKDSRRECNYSQTKLVRVGTSRLRATISKFLPSSILRSINTPADPWKPLAAKNS